MGEGTVRVKVGVTLPYRNGRYVPHQPDDVIPLTKLKETIVRAVDSGDRLLMHVLEPI